MKFFGYYAATVALILLVLAASLWLGYYAGTRATSKEAVYWQQRNMAAQAQVTALLENLARTETELAKLRESLVQELKLARGSLEYHREQANGLRATLLARETELAEVRKESLREIVVTYDKTRQELNKTDSLFEDALRNNLPSRESAGWALLRYGQLMALFEERATRERKYYGWGNLGDFAFPLLQHIAVSSKAGLIPYDQFKQRFERMVAYVQPNDRTSIETLASISKFVD